jgi:hypothetical protein
MHAVSLLLLIMMMMMLMMMTAAPACRVLVGDGGLTVGQLRFYPGALSISAIEEIYRQPSLLQAPFFHRRSPPCPSATISQTGTCRQPTREGVEQGGPEATGPWLAQSGGADAGAGRAGGPLEDFSTGSRPASFESEALVDIGHGLVTSVKAVEETVRQVQPRSEVDLVLQAVQAHADAKAEAAHTRSPPAPVGMQALSDPRQDALTGREYTLLLEGPATLTKPPPGQERYFDPAKMPSW